MRIRLYIACMACLLLPAQGAAQLIRDAQDPLVHRKSGMALGAHLYTAGMGMDVYGYRELSTGWQLAANLSLANLKHPKEVRIPSLYSSQGGKDFIFDKKHHAFTLAGTVGIQRQLVPLNAYNKFSVTVGLGAGPALTLLKPYYVEVAVPINATQARVELHPYEAQRFGYSDIVGRADFFEGMGELKAMLGGRLRAYATFNLAGSTLYIRALHLGAMLDVYAREVEIMDTQSNKAVHANLYVGFLLGNAW